MISKANLLRVNIFFTTLIFVLITSPSLSLMKKLFGTRYIPNEKIAVVLLLSFLSFRFKNNIVNIFKQYSKYIIITFLLLLYLLTRDLIIPIYFNIKNYNLIVVMFSIPIYFYYFDTIKKDILWKVLDYTVLLHLAIAVFQFIAVYNRQLQLSMFFHNHPYQENYLFYYRVPGLFMESSQFASFMALYLILKVKDFGKSVFKSPIFIIALIGCITNNAITAYLILLAYFFLVYKHRLRALSILLVFVAIDYYLLNIFKSYYMPLVEKIIRSLIFTEENSAYNRFSESYKILRDLTKSYQSFFLGGIGVSIVSADLVSYFFYYLGSIGLFLYLLFLCVTLIGVPYSLIAIYTCLCVTNAQITSPINLIFLILFHRYKKPVKN